MVEHADSFQQSSSLWWECGGNAPLPSSWHLWFFCVAALSTLLPTSCNDRSHQQQLPAGEFIPVAEKACSLSWTFHRQLLVNDWRSDQRLIISEFMPSLILLQLVQSIHLNNCTQLARLLKDNNQCWLQGEAPQAHVVLQQTWLRFCLKRVA